MRPFDGVHDIRDRALRSRRQQFGIFDLKDLVWYGDDDGPALYDEREIAHAAMRIICLRFDVPRDNVEVRPYDGTARRIRDGLPARMSSIEALRLLGDNAPEDDGDAE